MPIILIGFVLIPLLVGTLAAYLTFRLTMRRRKWIRPLPPIFVILITTLIGVHRYRLWGEGDVSPLTQLLFVPGLPALSLLIGMLFGWRLWRRWWGPKVIWDKTRDKE